jgi:CBS domain-containing protein
MPPTVREYMTRDIDLVITHPEMTGYVAIGLLVKHKISGMPVVDEAGKLIGMLSERDCLKTLASAQYYNLPTALVRDLMSTELTSVAPDTEILAVADLFLNNKFRRLPVLDKGLLVGQISRRDVLRAIQEMR